MTETTYSKRTATMTWRGEQPAAFKAGLAEFSENYKKDPVGAFSTLSSVYYSYASHRMRNDLRGNFLRRAAVMLYIAWLVFRAMRVSDRMVRLAGSLEKLTVNQLDVRQSIMRRVRRWEAARKAIAEAFGKHPQRPHTTALLFIGMADVFRHAGNVQEEKNAWKDVEELVPEIEQEARTAGDYRQLARIYRHLKEYYSPRDKAQASRMADEERWATRKAEELDAAEH